MLIKSITGATEFQNERCDKPIGYVGIKIDLKYAALANEEIEIHIQRDGGNNENITKYVNLKRLLMAQQSGEGAVFQTQTHMFGLIDLGSGASYDLENGEEVKISMRNLDGAKLYKVYGIETPDVRKVVRNYEVKRLLAGDNSKNLEVAGFDLVVIEGIDTITQLDITYLNGYTGNYSNDELIMLQSQNNDIAVADNDATAAKATSYVHAGDLVLGLQNVSRIHIETDGTAKEIVLSQLVGQIEG